MSYNFKHHLDKATELYATKELSSLRYCALELRLAIEAHVYNQLKASLGNIPEKVVNTWQPPQAIRMLCMFDEVSDMDLYVTISGEDMEAIKVNYNNIKYKDMQKWYNTLGSYLHQPIIKKIDNFKMDADKLGEVIEKLQRLLQGNLITLNRGYSKIQCEKCLKDILFTEHYMTNNEKLECQNPGCKNYAIIRKAEDGVNESFQKANVPCFSCGEKHSLFLYDIDAQIGFTCKKCGNVHQIASFIHSQNNVVPVPSFSFTTNELNLESAEDDSKS
ncbi:hypothetical protein M8Q33_16340 [Enterobacter hormaechei]|uniref:hypothetical protein n=1 Tax=Enterobacter hormaechei TaxID=158836 RepID=UPI002075784C|nr:hypothetical protein [Enterobacter hormaechei]MCM7598614.1 hypothetical protein [Enterobacter hormaechei]